MPATRNFKIGLFVLAGLAAVVVAAIVLGLHVMRPATTAYHTFFDESVQGLDVGSPVKYRGVRIGAVADIGIAEDRKHVDVVLSLSTRAADSLGLDTTSPQLRTQLVVQGLTGIKYVEIDFADPERNPPPELPFTPPEHYIPSRPSLFTGLAGDVEVLSQRLPEMAERLEQTMDKLDRVLDEVSDEQLVARAGEAIDRFGDASAGVGRLAKRVDRSGLPDQAAATLAAARHALTQATGVLQRIGGDRGLVASAQRATDAIGDAGRSATSSADDLGRTVRELGDAARAVRDLAEELERQPDILVKGRERTGRR